MAGGRAGKKAGLENEKQEKEGPIPSAASPLYGLESGGKQGLPQTKDTSPSLGKERRVDSCRGSNNPGSRCNTFPPAHQGESETTVSRSL